MITCRLRKESRAGSAACDLTFRVAAAAAAANLLAGQVVMPCANSDCGKMSCTLVIHLMCCSGNFQARKHRDTSCLTLRRRLKLKLKLLWPVTLTSTFCCRNACVAGSICDGEVSTAQAAALTYVCATGFWSVVSLLQKSTALTQRTVCSPFRMLRTRALWSL